MKNFSRVSLLFLLVCFAACAVTRKNPTLVGKWKLSETLADPGDGSGKWNPVTKDAFLTFYADGTVKSTEFPDYRRYAIIDSNKIEFILQDNRKQVVTINRQASVLILSPQCIEACGSKYLKVN